ncbi:nuclear transport factor 2 family protein [Sorangium sp. So ce1151]|uniref:nuclear transport factor 2 family protein n=1 Tax=Sorangium sp. So ce1151 TaxID=3133332 RepID=UPI003F5F9473
MQVPGPLAGYVAAQNARSVDAMLACFTDDAVVRDERREYRGTSSIRGWMEETTTKYHPRLEVLDVRTANGQVLLSVSVSGTFAGSPLQLRYDVTLDRDRIARLEIDG